MIKIKGFTLLELLFTLCFIIVLFLWSVPTFKSQVSNNHLSSIEAELVSAVNYAKNTALLTNKVLTLNPDPQTQNWSDGAILFEDNAAHHYQEGDKIFYQWHWPNQSIQITWQGFQSSTYLSFASTPFHASLSGHFTLTTIEGKQEKIVINRIGRIKIIK